MIGTIYTIENQPGKFLLLYLDQIAIFLTQDARFYSIPAKRYHKGIQEGTIQPEMIVDKPR